MARHENCEEDLGANFGFSEREHVVCAIKESTEAHEGAHRQTSLHNVNCVSFERGKTEEHCECSSENG